MSDDTEYLPGDNLPLPSTPPQEPSGHFEVTLHTHYPVPSASPCCAQRGPYNPQPESDLRPASGILWAAIAGGLIWVVVLCLLSR